MSSGRVQLAAVGIQDQFLTGNPDVSYFIKKFNRHTKFALEVLNTTFFQTNINFGSWVNTIIPRNGQLIRNLYVRLVLPPLTCGGYTKAIGNAIIEHADLVIGGQTIERINGEYMQIYDQSFISDSQQTAISYMVGPTIAALDKATAYTSGGTQPLFGWFPRTFIVPLPFYFIRNEALSIPLCALTRQEVEVRIKFRPLEQVTSDYDTDAVTVSGLTWTKQTLSYSPTIPTYLPSSSSFSYLENGSTSNTLNYIANSNSLLPSNYTSQQLGVITGIIQNNSNGTLVISDDTGSNNLAFSTSGLNGQFYGSSIVPPAVFPRFSFMTGATDGVNFTLLANTFVFPTTTYYIVNFTAPFVLGQQIGQYSSYLQTTIPISQISWSPLFQAFVVGTTVGGPMYTYTIGASGLTIINGETGPYSCYSNTFGQIYNVSPVTCSDTIISNVYQWTSTNITPWNTNLVGPTPITNGQGIAYNPLVGNINAFTIADGSDVYLGTVVSTSTPCIPTIEPGYHFQSSLLVEYVFLADEEIKYIQGAKIDYVITQLQLASVVIPAGETTLNGYRLYFINPVKEMFFTIQDSNVVTVNDYFNYYNNSTTVPSQQLINLQLQLNGEDIISPTIADALYLGKVQFLNNHTRLPPSMAIYNYSFAIDPENYLPTGQVNMSRVMNQNLWLNLTPNPNSRTVNIYAKAYNILRVQNGLAGVLFIDNNFI